MDREEKQKEISRALPLFWNSYQHMYDVRVGEVNNARNFLLVTISFLLVNSISLFFWRANMLFLFSWILQLIALLLLFKTFFIKTVVHWFEYKKTLEKIKDREFDKDLFSTLKALEDWTFTYQGKAIKIMESTLVLILFSICLLLISFVGIYFSSHLNWTIYLTIIFLALILFDYYKKPLKYDFDKKYEKVWGEFDERISNSL